MMGPRTRARAGTLLLGLAATATTLIAVEVAARVARHVQGPPPTKQATGDHLEYDPLLGWRKRPSLRTSIRQWEYSVPLFINAHGLRDPERDYEATQGTLRILALGDSFIEGYTVPLEQTATQVLETNLHEAGIKVEVINGGTAGYSTDQEYLFYKSEGVKYSPKITILFFYYNDVLYNGLNRAFGRPKPLLKLQDDGSLQPTRYPVRRMTHALDNPADSDDEQEHRSAFVEWLGSRLSHSNRGLYNRLATLGLWRPLALHKGVPLEMRVYERSPVPELAFSWEQTAVILRAFVGDARSSGAHFLLVYVPSRLEVDDSSWTASQDLYQIDERNWDRRHVVNWLHARGQESGFPVLDLTATMREMKGAAYLRLDEHWNAIGHRVAALQVSNWLSQVGWLQ